MPSEHQPVIKSTASASVGPWVVLSCPSAYIYTIQNNGTCAVFHDNPRRCHGASVDDRLLQHQDIVRITATPQDRRFGALRDVVVSQARRNDLERRITLGVDRATLATNTTSATLW